MLTSLHLRAGERLSAAEYLQLWGPELFPDYFASTLHPFFDSLMQLHPDERVAVTEAAFPLLRAVCSIPSPLFSPDISGILHT